jgi:hypothetical protein
MRHGIIFAIIVSFCTLFLNFDIFPVKAQKEVVEEKEWNLSTETRLPQDMEHAPMLSLEPKVEEPAPIESEIAPAIQKKMAASLFKLTMNPSVPSFILQGNSVIDSASPQKDFTSYLYPDEWETVGDIYIRDNHQNKWIRLQLDQQLRQEIWGSRESAEALYTPKKKICWLNNEEFLTIIGYALGSVSTGGDLVKVNRVTGQAEILYPAHLKENQEVTDFELSGERLTVQINGIDDDGLSLDHGGISVPLDKLLTLAEIEPVWEVSANTGK